MIRLPSLQRTFDLYWTSDDALEQPPAAPARDASPEEHAAHKEADAAYHAKLRAAWETGDWSPLLIPGKSPTKFVCAQVDREIWRSIMERHLLPADNKQHISNQRMYSLVFRLAVVDIVGLDGVKVRREHDEEWGWTMATRDIVNVLDAGSMHIVSEIGAVIASKLWSSLSGKSSRG